MGWIFRKSLNFGPFRINLSKSGVGGSFGVGPFRIGRSASGRGYTSTRIPGTGISYRTSSGAGAGSGGRGGNAEGGKNGCGLGCGCILFILAALAALATGVLMVTGWAASGSTP